MRRAADSSAAPAAPRRLLPARLAALAAVLLAAIVTAVATAGPAAAQFRVRDDWHHVAAVVAALRHDPPSAPVVLLLGGSSARESITTERDWRRQIAALGGGRVRAYNLGASSQGYKDDLEIVRALPAVPTILLIGINLGRYTKRFPHEAASARGTLKAAYDSHRFHEGQQLADAAKRALVIRWLHEKYPIFKDRYRGNARVLRTLIALCRERGFSPVLVELPIDLPVVRHSLDAPRGRYHAGCRAAARPAGIPYVDFVGRIGLVSRDFVDLSHLVESGRVKYQRRLSRLVVAKLKQYGLTGRAPASAGCPAAR